MSERTFLDTNVLIYADDPSAGSKQSRAREVIQEAMDRSLAVVSTQVLQEYYSTAIRKLKLAPAAARDTVDCYARLDVVVVKPNLILRAIDLSRLRPVSFWDALVIQAAAVAGCTRLYTEDLNAGQIIEGVRIVNPFAA